GDRVVLLDLPQPAPHAESRLHDDRDALAESSRPHGARGRVAFSSRRDRAAGLRVSRCGRLLGRDEPRGLAHLRAGAGGHLVARVSAGTILRTRDVVMGLRSGHPAGARSRALTRDPGSRRDERWLVLALTVLITTPR